MESLDQKKIWSFRAYHGIGEDGRRVDEWTQDEIADVFCVDSRTVRRWLRDPPSIESLSLPEREIVFIFAVTGNDPTGYIERAVSDQDEEPEEPKGMLGLESDFSPW